MRNHLSLHAHTHVRFTIPRYVMSTQTNPLKPPKDTGTPGPGTYTATETRTGQKLDWEPPQSHKSSFKATPHKLTLVGNLEAPPPSKYVLVSLSSRAQIRASESSK